jgi:lipopolysaccharide biosynthesis glycosyltransferase
VSLFEISNSSDSQVKILQGPPLHDEMFVTYIDSSDSDLPGLQAMATSLLDIGSTRGLAVIVTDNPSEALQKTASCLKFTLVRMPGDVSNLLSPDSYSSQDRADFSSRFRKVLPKLNIWRLPVKRAIYLDYDMVALQNIDELFEAGEPVLRAAPNKLWDGSQTAFTMASDKGIFNSGLLVVRPSEATFRDMVRKLPEASADSSGFGQYSKFAEDGSDQGFLNAYFEEAWVGDAILDTAYNTMWWYAATHDACDLSKIKVLQNAGDPKPWMKKKRSLFSKIEHPFTWLSSNIHENACSNSDEAWERASKSYNRRCN